MTEGALTFVPIKSALNVAQVKLLPVARHLPGTYKCSWLPIPLCNQVSICSCLFFQTLDSMRSLQTIRCGQGTPGRATVLLHPPPSCFIHFNVQ